jgi:predicted nucleic acid-binding protein
VVVEPEGLPDKNPRAPADQPMLLTLLAARADYLLAGDKSFLALAEQYPILTLARFFERHGE